MRLSLVILAVALQAAVLESFAQETKQPNNTYTVPDEHKEFVQQFNILLKKFPKAEKRFKLADMGDPPVERHVVNWKCRDVGGFVDCVPEVLQ